MSKRLELTDQKFGKLTVTSMSHTGHSSFWNCLCECGKTVVVAGSNLTRKNGTVSCGCQKIKNAKNLNVGKPSKNRKEFGRASFNWLYNSYKRSAKQRNLIFDITEELFKQLTKQNCYYCGIIPSGIAKSSSPRFNGTYIYNGIDRKDNTIGYLEKNCLPCCKICNMMKKNISFEDFLKKIKNINEHLSL